MKCEKSAKIISCLNNAFGRVEIFLEKYIKPILLLTIRFMIAAIFFKSCLTKISNFESTIFLFENEYNVPILNPICAAYVATIFELVCSVLLALGFATRLACLPLIGMTLVIQFFILQNPQHFYWLALLATIFTFGAGRLSVDYLVKRCVGKCFNQ
jgi:putative oxidoreductase